LLRFRGDSEYLEFSEGDLPGVIDHWHTASFSGKIGVEYCMPREQGMARRILNYFHIANPIASNIEGQNTRLQTAHTHDLGTGSRAFYKEGKAD
jgi:hypothetical protein